MSQKTAYTSLYTPDALSLMKKLKDAFSAKWPSAQMKNASRRLDKAEFAPDGEVIFPPTEYWSEGQLWSRPDAEILRWLAIHLKLVVKDHHQWYRANDEVVTILSSDKCKVTVADTYLVYDAFLGRKNLGMKYSKGQIARWIGLPRDPVTTEMEVARRQEIKNLKESAAAKIANARENMYNKQNEYRTKLQEEYLAQVKAIQDECELKIKDLTCMIFNNQGLTDSKDTGSSESLAS